MSAVKQFDFSIPLDDALELAAFLDASAKDMEPKLLMFPSQVNMILRMSAALQEQLGEKNSLSDIETAIQSATDRYED